jgi:hypothetical protein
VQNYKLKRKRKNVSTLSSYEEIQKKYVDKKLFLFHDIGCYDEKLFSVLTTENNFKNLKRCEISLGDGTFRETSRITSTLHGAWYIFWKKTASCLCFIIKNHLTYSKIF